MDPFSSMRIACLSGIQEVREDQRIAGIIVYSIGNYPAKDYTGRNIYPGYVVLRDSDQIQAAGGEGLVHGDLCLSVFKE